MVILAAMWLLGAAPAAAQQAPEQAIGEIRDLVLHAQYGEAIRAAQGLIAREDLTARERNAALEVLATAQIANRDRTGATRTLGLLYARDPDHQLGDPDAGPDVQAAFARARDAHRSPIDVRISHEPPRLAIREAPLVEVELGDGGDAVDELRVGYRRAGDRSFAFGVMTLEQDGSASTRIPLQPGSSAYEIEYYVEALAPSRAVLGQLGSEVEPLTLRVPAESSILVGTGDGDEPARGPGEDADSGSSILGQWWFWTIVALAVGGGVAAYVLLGPPSDGPADGSLGSVTLGLEIP